MALCVNPDETYVKVKAEDGTVYYLAQALCDKVLGEGKYEVLESCTGKELEYKEYEPLFPFVQMKQKAYYVVCDTYVTLTDGTRYRPHCASVRRGRLEGRKKI